MKNLVLISGPTASGKSLLSHKVLDSLGTGSIISADSRQCYRGLDIGTAKPKPEEILNFNYRLIDCVNLEDSYDAGSFAEDANSYILKEEDQPTIVVGGTGLYIQALLFPLDHLPAANPQLREEWSKKHEQHGLKILHEEIMKLDPKALEIVDRHNPQRLIRVIEICNGSGTKYSLLVSEKKAQPAFKYRLFAIDLNRTTLYERINRRVEKMFKAGWVEETESLRGRNDGLLRKTIGYAEILDLLDNKLDRADCLQMIQQQTRRYAKRQLTWLRKMENVEWIDPDEVDKILVALSPA